MDAHPGEVFHLVQEECDKNYLEYMNPIEFDVSPLNDEEGKFDIEIGAFADKWNKMVYDDDIIIQYPSLSEVLIGLKKFFDDIIDEKFAKVKSDEDILAFKNQQH